jgi:riboflavin transporter FmnP
MQPGYAPPVVGSLGLGFCAGFFGGCIGLILVYAIAKGPETKRGAGMGFAAQIVVGVIMRVIGAAMR